MAGVNYLEPEKLGINKFDEYIEKLSDYVVPSSDWTNKMSVIRIDEELRLTHDEPEERYKNTINSLIENDMLQEGEAFSVTELLGGQLAQLLPEQYCVGGQYIFSNAMLEAEMDVIKTAFEALDETGWASTLMPVPRDSEGKLPRNEWDVSGGIEKTIDHGMRNIAYAQDG